MAAIRSVSVIATLVVLAGTSGCASGTAGGAGPTSSVTITPELINQGRLLYAGPGRCGSCHGASGRGGRLAPDLTDAQWIWVQSNRSLHDQLFEIIKTGIPQPRQFPAPMPAMGGANLTDDQVHALAAYVQSIGPE